MLILMMTMTMTNDDNYDDDDDAFVRCPVSTGFRIFPVMPVTFDSITPSICNLAAGQQCQLQRLVLFLAVLLLALLSLSLAQVCFQLLYLQHVLLMLPFL